MWYSNAIQRWLGLGALGLAAVNGPPWPLGINLFVLGFGNGVFAVAAIGSMMGLAGAGLELHVQAQVVGQLVAVGMAELALIVLQLVRFKLQLPEQ